MAGTNEESTADEASLPVTTWLDRLSGPHGSPGGGAACAVLVAVSAALLAMVGGYSADDSRVAQAVDRLVDARRRALDAAEADSRRSGELGAALREDASAGAAAQDAGDADDATGGADEAGDAVDDAGDADDEVGAVEDAGDAVDDAGDADDATGGDPVPGAALSAAMSAVELGELAASLIPELETMLETAATYLMPDLVVAAEAAAAALGGTAATARADIKLAVAHGSGHDDADVAEIVAAIDRMDAARDRVDTLRAVAAERV